MKKLFLLFFSLFFQSTFSLQWEDLADESISSVVRSGKNVSDRDLSALQAKLIDPKNGLSKLLNIVTPPEVQFSSVNLDGLSKADPVPNALKDLSAMIDKITEGSLNVTERNLMAILMQANAPSLKDEEDFAIGYKISGINYYVTTSISNAAKLSKVSNRFNQDVQIFSIKLYKPDVFLGKTFSIVSSSSGINRALKIDNDILSFDVVPSLDNLSDKYLFFLESITTASQGSQNICNVKIRSLVSDKYVSIDQQRGILVASASSSATLFSILRRSSGIDSLDALYSNAVFKLQNDIVKFIESLNNVLPLMTSDQLEDFLLSLTECFQADANLAKDANILDFVRTSLFSKVNSLKIPSLLSLWFPLAGQSSAYQIDDYVLLSIVKDGQNLFLGSVTDSLSFASNEFDIDTLTIFQLVNSGMVGYPFKLQNIKNKKYLVANSAGLNFSDKPSDATMFKFVSDLNSKKVTIVPSGDAGVVLSKSARLTISTAGLDDNSDLLSAVALPYGGIKVKVYDYLLNKNTGSLIDIQKGLSVSLSSARPALKDEVSFLYRFLKGLDRNISPDIIISLIDSVVREVSAKKVLIDGDFNLNDLNSLAQPVASIESLNGKEFYLKLNNLYLQKKSYSLSSFKDKIVLGFEDETTINLSSLSCLFYLFRDTDSVNYFIFAQNDDGSNLYPIKIEAGEINFFVVDTNKPLVLSEFEKPDFATWAKKLSGSEKDNYLFRISGSDQEMFIQNIVSLSISNASDKGYLGVVQDYSGAKNILSDKNVGSPAEFKSKSSGFRSILKGSLPLSSILKPGLEDVAVSLLFDRVNYLRFTNKLKTDLLKADLIAFIDNICLRKANYKNVSWESFSALKNTSNSDLRFYSQAIALRLFDSRTGGGLSLESVKSLASDIQAIYDRTRQSGIRNRASLIQDDANSLFNFLKDLSAEFSSAAIRGSLDSLFKTSSSSSASTTSSNKSNNAGAATSNNSTKAVSSVFSTFGVLGQASNKNTAASDFGVNSFFGASDAESAAPVLLQNYYLQ